MQSYFQEVDLREILNLSKNPFLHSPFCFLLPILDIFHLLDDDPRIAEDLEVVDLNLFHGFDPLHQCSPFSLIIYLVPQSPCKRKDIIPSGVKNHPPHTCLPRCAHITDKKRIRVLFFWSLDAHLLFVNMGLII